MYKALLRHSRYAAVTLLFSCNASAEITRLEITSTQPYGTFRSGAYTIMQATLHGQLSPAEKIPGLDQAPLNASGKVEYSTKLVLTQYLLTKPVAMGPCWSMCQTVEKPTRAHFTTHRATNPFNPAPSNKAPVFYKTTDFRWQRFIGSLAKARTCPRLKMRKVSNVL